MKPFQSVAGVAAPLPIANLDTDQIIPKQFLSTVERDGLGRGLLYDLRFGPDGVPDPAFVLNQPAFMGASILIAGPNFGCGSSREHAPWALLDFGFRCVIAESFADIFAGNCLNNGILLVRLPADAVATLMQEAKGANHVFFVDLESQTVSAPSGALHRFDIDPGHKQKLLKGLDDIGQSLAQADAIAAFEARRRLQTPWLP
ncbi:MAG: 3-isopropylmalate dehydratase small subunit [Alphaproteobacteria bacterium]|jgi:3-isopropylmalate/(R)-2-methylmalate dehydratase small subunit|nr:3-isopropylmalate dehydratase small subunit [Alphaproteobacteria bacterium]